MTEPRIALCMMVRDEEAMLEGCLASVAGAVDQVVVVDTGSRDATMAIAARHGAKVVEQPWQDDFSAPRNRAIAEADAEWILVLDADERLTAGARQRLRELVRRGGFDLAMLPLHNAARLDCELEAVARGEGRLIDVAYLPRLLRKTDDLAYEGIIHESVAPWLLRGKRVAAIAPGVDIIHFGGVPDLRAQRRKSERNIRMLERYCERAPDDLTPYGYLAHEYLEAGRRDEARDVAERGWPLMERARPTEDLAALRLASARAWIRVQSGDPDGALASVERGLELAAGHPDLVFLRGCAHEVLALRAETAAEREHELECALAAYETARGKAGELFLQKFVQGCTDWAAEVRIGTAQLLRGRIAPAESAFERALAEQADCREAQWGRVECLLARSATMAAVRAVQPTLDDRPDGWVLAAIGAEAAGLLEQMASFVAKAQACLARGFIAPHRRERYHDVLCALAMYRGAAAEAPGPIGQLALLVQGRYEPVPGARARPLDRALLARIVRHLLRSGRAAEVEALVDPRAEALLPGLMEAIRATVAGLERSS